MMEKISNPSFCKVETVTKEEFESFKRSQLAKEQYLSDLVFLTLDIVRRHISDDEWYDIRKSVWDAQDKFKELREG